MPILTEKELHEIAGIFVFNGFSARCVTGANEDIYNDFKTMANTETGSLLLRRIYASNHDMLITIDAQNKDTKWGGKAGPHVNDKGEPTYQSVTIDYETPYPADRIATMVHELTHVLQFRTQGDPTCITDNPEQRYILDKMYEAEARLNETKLMYELIKDQPEKQAFYSPSPKTKIDIARYKLALSQTKDKGKINAYMFEYFYNDKKWLDTYQEQHLKVANAKDLSGLRGNVPSYSDVIDIFKGRLGFVSSNLPEDNGKNIDRFTNIRNMSDYNPKMIEANRHSKDSR